MKNSSNSLKPSSGADQKQLPSLPGKRPWTSWAILPVLGLAVASLTGCAGKYTGSGSIPSVAGNANKATISFTVQTDGDPDEDGFGNNVKGQLQFQDLAADVRIHGEILDAQVVPESVFIDGEIWPAGAIILSGPYTVQPPSTGKEGIFNIVAYSPQTAGNRGGGERLLVILYGDDSYYNFGLVSGGNITYHKEK